MKKITDPAIMNSLNLGVSAKLGDNPYLPISQKLTTQELNKAAGGETADLEAIKSDIENINVKLTTVETTANSALSKSESADKLASPQNITLTGAVTGAASFDGSAEASIETVLTNPVPEAATSDPVISGTATVGVSEKYAREDHVHPAQTDVTGNAGTADKLKTARNIELVGNVTGTASFDGSENIVINTTIINTGESITQEYADATYLSKEDASTSYATKVELSNKADTTALDSKLDTTTAESTYATKDELADKADNSALDTKLDTSVANATYAIKTDVDQLKLEDINQDGINTSVLSRLSSLEEQVDQLKKTNIEVVAVTSSDTDISKTDKDIVLTTTEPITAPTTIVGKSIEFKSLDMNSSLIKATANDGDIILSNVQTTGILDKSISNTAFAINTNDYVRITQANIQQSGYNCIEIGLNDTEPKNIMIDGIDFGGTLSNNVITVFATADNAVLTISNCHVSKCSNFLRLSNRTNHKLTVNIVNCTIDSWETTPTWAGMICLQDYTNKSNQSALEAKLFASEKITINITNVTGPNGKIIAPDNLSDILGSQIADKQIAYVVYGQNNTLLPYTGNETMYPTFNIK